MLLKAFIYSANKITYLIYKMKIYAYEHFTHIELFKLLCRTVAIKYSLTLFVPICTYIYLHTYIHESNVIGN